MKNILLEILLILISITGFSQENGYDFIPDNNPKLKIENLKTAKTIHDLSPDFCRYLNLPTRQQFSLDDRLNRKKLFFASTIRPLGSYLENRQYIQKDFDRIIQYEMVEVITTQSGKAKSARGTSEKLTTEQRALLLSADPESTVKIKIRFVYKTPKENAPEAKSETNEGEFQVRLVPDSEAEFPGGEKPMLSFFQNQISAIIARTIPGEIPGTTRVVFTINEKGQVENVGIPKASADSRIDKIILQAIKGMPKSKPAKNTKGQSIKQEFRFSFGQNDGC